GTPQSAAVGMPFRLPLAVTVKDAAGNPVSGATISFSAPSNGAGAVLSSLTTITNGAGVAQVTATANGNLGAYPVTAAIGSLSVTFLLTNLAATSVVLSTGSNPSQFGAPLMLTAAVTPVDAAGKITFYDGTIVLGIR